MPDPAQTSALLGIGAFAGFFGALLGLGGGVFLVPVLVLWIGVDMTHAVAASLTAVIATSSAAASVYVEKGLVNLKLGVILETVTVLGALGGGVSAAYLPSRALIALFGVVLLGIAALLVSAGPEADGSAPEAADGALMGEYLDPAAGRIVRYRVRRLRAALSASFVAGILSSLLGIGGGILKVPILHLFCGVPMKAAAATSTYMIGVTAAAGAIVYFVRGAVDPVLSGITVLGVFAGSRLGTAVSPRVKGRLLRRMFALVAAALAVQMLGRALRGG